MNLQHWVAKVTLSCALLYLTEIKTACSDMMMPPPLHAN